MPTDKEKDSMDKEERKEMPHENSVPTSADATPNPLDSDITTTREQIEQVETLPQSREILGIPIEFCQDGKKAELKTDQGRATIRVNIKRFPTPEDAIYEATKQACYIAERRKILEEKDNETIQKMSEQPHVLRKILELRGLERLKIWQEQEATELTSITPTHLTYGQQFDYACEQYILTDQFPDDLPKNVRDAVTTLPQQGDQNALNFIVQERRKLESAGDIYKNHVQHPKNALLKEEKELKKTESDDYVPPPFDGETEPLDPEKVQFKVHPFCGGYYRGEVFRYNSQTLRIEADSTDKETFSPQDLPEDINELTQYTFEGTWPGSFQSGKEPILPLPYTNTHNALPLPATLEPKDMFTLMRSRHGVFSLEPKSEIPDGTRFQFTFVLCKTGDNTIDDEPLPQDTLRFSGPFDNTSRETIENIGGNAFLTKTDRARAVASSTRSRFTYPKEDQMPEMNQRYADAQDALLPEMDEYGLADCHWSNNHAMIVGRELDIPWRVVSGYYITKHPDVDFAPIGGIGHEWSEIWNDSDPEDCEWIKLDATPQKEDEDDEDKEDDDKDMGDMEVEESGIFEFSDKDIDELLKEVSESKGTPYDIAEALFKQRTKIDPKKWGAIEQFIQQVNGTSINQNDQIPENPKLRTALGNRINAPMGTLEREWQKLFALICDHRTIEKRAFRGPVPRSEGEYIDDFVAAAIGALSDDPDPVDSKVSAQRKVEVLDITEFEEDAIIDLTSSMEEVDEFGNTMKVEQKKLILSLLYHLMKLNESLNDSRTKKDLREPLQINSAIYSIHGSSKNDQGIWSLLKTNKDSITERLLCELADELDKTTPGSGDLLSALRAYRESITDEVRKKLASGKFVKLLTIYSDGNMYCNVCGGEGCQVEMHHEQIKATQDEIAQLREMGVIVQGIGFTQKAQAIKVICQDENNPEAAIIVDDVSKAVLVRQKMLTKHLKKL